ncbi:MAG: DeoR family transcriptional regulator [Alphaproteobacteria bacterium]
MIKSQRHARIMSLLRDRQLVSVSELCAALPGVSTVTIRRDIAELARTGMLARTHGGAMLPAIAATAPARTNGHLSPEHERPPFDALVLPPIAGRGADALRREVVRRGLPFVAESAPQPGGIYVGPDNLAAGRDLGVTAGRIVARERASAGLLLVGQDTLENTRARAAGFEAGFRETFPGPVDVVRVNGQGSYKPALMAALDAFETTPGLNVVLGVNDHSALAGLDAARRLDRTVSVFAVGGESPGFVGQLAEGGPLRAVAALFPEVVGFRVIDVIALARDGRREADVGATPHKVLTAETVGEVYERAADGWALRTAVRDALLGGADPAPAPRLSGQIGFMPHFPAHDWYRVMTQAMHTRCARYGLKLTITPPDMEIARELTRLRRQIARAAAASVRPGETVIVGCGEIGAHMAERLKECALAAAPHCRGLTVITNALEVLERLTGAPEIKVILTAGEYQAADRCLVGPSLGALFEQMRADRAFLSVDGVSARFGISAADERLALAGTRFVRAARSVVAMADHTLIAAEANHRICPISDADTVITDDGSLPADRLALRAAGVEVVVAGDAPEAIATPANRAAVAGAAGTTAENEIQHQMGGDR